MFPKCDRHRGENGWRTTNVCRRPHSKAIPSPDMKMFTKILIAEPWRDCCRVIATARKMGIKTVAVVLRRRQGSAPRQAGRRGRAHWRRALRESYLLADKIIAACQANRRTGHPPRLRIP